MVIRPPLLKKNDTVAIVAPGSWVTKDEIKDAISVFENWDLAVIQGATIGQKYNRYAGNDALRKKDLQQMLDQPDVKAIFCARVGYGTTRIIDQLDFTAFLRTLKWIIGFSDITTLLFKLYQYNIESIHAVMPFRFYKKGHATSIESLRKLLFGAPLQIETPPSIGNRVGKATAPVVGGNLTLICRNIGTLSDIDMQNKMLVLEDVCEKLYRLDAMMGQIQRIGRLAHLAGLVVGEMIDMEDDQTNPFGKNAYEIIQEYVAAYTYPVGFNFPIGHNIPNLAFPHGRTGSLIVEKNKSKLLL